MTASCWTWQLRSRQPWPTTTYRPTMVLAGSPVGELLTVHQYPCCTVTRRIALSQRSGLFPLEIECGSVLGRLENYQADCQAEQLHLAAWRTLRSPMLEKALTRMLFRSPLITAPLHTDTCVPW